jgi:hypothetical protein
LMLIPGGADSLICVNVTALCGAAAAVRKEIS